MTDIKPITPRQAKAGRMNIIPDEVLDAFNELITENMNRDQSTFKQKDVLTRIRSKLNDTFGNQYTDQVICNSGWLNIEDLYRAAGWKVGYDRPGYNETGDATFNFTTKR